VTQGRNCRSDSTSITLILYHILTQQRYQTTVINKTYANMQGKSIFLQNSRMYRRVKLPENCLLDKLPAVLPLFSLLHQTVSDRLLV